METLIIFVKNPVSGKVKTRLAATIGDKKALEIYQKLLMRTMEITRPVKLERIVYYSHQIDQQDIWDNSIYKKEQQHGDTLGERMMNAFAKTFSETNGPVCIIGSDCYQLETKIIEEAFNQLKEQDVVIGPSEDGEYYLLGMKKYYPQLFEGIEWSSGKEFGQTMRVLRNLNLRARLLPTLIDVDTAEDLQSMD